ncbi:CRP-like cAMP-binding protein [Dongia mobilis]|uniref:CRP-like cAMP-binding protein n=1 Tax=Dongia mobilis TaxID=578943 RepID=A0A4R6WJD5_9PROT|nr:Crp/Fnr family transcriptional regulator [Dongia mobilis]TDQ80502.1 CRP-like cAMP-binding protein [Dongia mobilis]
MPICPATPPSCTQCPRLATAFYGPTSESAAAEFERLREGTRAVPAKRIIYRAGDVAKEMQILLSGWAFRYKLLTGGRRQIISFALPGDPVAMRMLFLDRGAFSVQALTDCTLCTFDRESFADFVGRHQRLAENAKLLCVESNAATEELLADIGRRTAYERVGRLILSLARRMQAKGLLQGLVGYLPLSQAHIADALGLTAIHVGRVLRQLKDDRVLTFSRTQFEIHDLPALERL